MNYEGIRLDKSMYKNEGGFSRMLEKLDPTSQYAGTDYAHLDAFQRQLKRFDIKVSGAHSDTIAKFFKTGDSSHLFPEYVARAVAQGAKEASILEEITSSKTMIDSMDYRSLRTDLSGMPLTDTIAEGAAIPETNITLNEHLVELKKRGRLLCASYEAIKFQRVDVFTVALRQIGAHISKAQLKDGVEALIDGNGSVPPADVITCGSANLTYGDLLALWNQFEDFEMNTLLCAPDMAAEVLKLEEFKNPQNSRGQNGCGQNGCGFPNTGALATPMGARLMKSAAVPAGKIIALDNRFALEMVCAGDIGVEYDKLIDTQLERAAVTAVYGFSKIFPDAVKVLERQ